MLHSDAMKILIGENEEYNETVREFAFTKIAEDLANQEANTHRMTREELKDLFDNYRALIVNLYNNDKKWRNKDNEIQDEFDKL